MSEKIDYETFLPALTRGEFYIVKCKDTRNCYESTYLLHSGELVKGCSIIFKSTVNRIVHEEGGTYLGIGVIHA